VTDAGRSIIQRNRIDALAADYRSLRILLVLTGIALAATLIVYKPWSPGPFDIIDFSEFLPLLHRNTQYERWSGFLRYYASQGRWNILGYAALILKWGVFGTNVVGWQWARFAEMWFVMVAAYFVLRRFGSDLVGAAAGAGIFMFAGPAVTGWLRLTMGEALGLCFLFPAVWIAAGYRNTTHWRRDAVLIAIFICLALLSKEMLVAFVPFVLVVGCCLSGPGRLAQPRYDDRTRWLVGISAVAGFVVLLPVALVAHAAPAGNFASQYMTRPFSLRQSLENLCTVVLPAGPARTGGLLGRFTASANILFLAIVAIGAIVLWRRGPAADITKRQMIAWSALVLLLPLTVVAAYQPWSVFQDFYALPGVFSAAMLIAVSVTATDLLAPRWSFAVGAIYIAMTGIGGVRAAAVRARYNAKREVNGAVVSYLAQHAAGRPVIVVAHGFSGSHWPGTGPALGRYAAALYPNVSFGKFQDDTTCTLPPRTASSTGSAVIVSYSDDCGTYPNPSVAFVSRYHYLALHPPARLADSMRIDVCDADCTRPAAP
jgi:hypothetical protein